MKIPAGCKPATTKAPSAQAPPRVGGFVPKAFGNCESTCYEFSDSQNKSKLSSLHGTRSREVFHAHVPKFGLKYLKALTRSSETIKTGLLGKGKKAEGEEIDMLS